LTRPTMPMSWLAMMDRDRRRQLVPGTPSDRAARARRAPRAPRRRATSAGSPCPSPRCSRRPRA
jgi:hypothetical protein